MGSTRLTTVFCVIALAFALAPAGARAQEPRFAIEPGLLARLQTLAAGLHSEIVLCLTGISDGSDSTATGFVMPDPNVSQADRASFGPCPAGTIAIWHNHPLERHTASVPTASGGYALPSGPARPHGDPNLRPADLCALSRTDIRTLAREAAPFAVVSVDRETWCWWSLEQVRELVASGAPRGDPVPGQVASPRPSYQPR